MVRLHHQQQIQMGRCVLMRERDNYLDEEIETVSARQRDPQVAVEPGHSMPSANAHCEAYRAEVVECAAAGLLSR